MKLHRWLLPALAIIAVLAVAWWELDTARTGPGPLHPAHAALEPLRQGRNCEGCHDPGQGVSAARCTACHAPIGAQLLARNGLHGGLSPELAADCAHCHGEHHGAAVALLTPHAFARAGIADPAVYAHEHVAGFTLTGVHTGLACARCHVHADSTTPPAGGRFLGLRQDCASCHDDVHRGAFGADCASCHGQEQPFRNVPSFRHDVFALRGAHAGQTCASCHPAAGPHSIENLREAPQPARACRDCHQDPHRADVSPERRAMLVADAGDCARCHDATRFAAHRITTANHGQVGPSLRGPHAAVACAACHGDRERPPRWSPTVAAPAMTDCAVCHESPHRRSLLATDVPSSQQCAECHRDDHGTFAAATLTSAQHARVGFPLAAPHHEPACAKCHAAGGTFAARHPGRDAADCAACHRDPHGGQFAGRPDTACTTCHLTASFRPTTFDLAAHQHSRFPLLGAHGAVACTNCHRDVHDGVRRFRPLATGCKACHADPHGGRFDRPGLPAEVAGRTDCARCHDERSFTEVPSARFDHALWTGHALDGAHAALACARCHARQPVPDALGSRFGKALGTSCSDCHQDPHQGQFAVTGRTDCARCHDTTAFTAVTFDHQLDARFALDELHGKLDCARCHQSVDTPQGPVVRYRPLGTACADCHGPPKRGGR